MVVGNFNLLIKNAIWHHKMSHHHRPPSASAVVCNAFDAMKNGHHKTGEQCFVYLKNESINKQWLCCMDYGLIIKTELDIIIVIISGAAWGMRRSGNNTPYYYHHAHTCQHM